MNYKSKQLLYKLVIRQLPLLLTVFLLSGFFPSSGSLLCPVVTQAGPRTYGTHGKDGIDGRVGRDGRDGQNQTVFTNSSPINLDLSGQDGEDGEDGDRGFRPECDNQPDNVNYDVYAPDGGDGGDGGRGGNGGNGGSLTVYYTNLADLKNILVRAVGGKGGRGGRGGYGTEGCRCRVRTWEKETCQGNPGSSDRSCQTRRYRCHDGSTGRNGGHGQDGKQGSLGILSIVKGKETIIDDNPTINLPISELVNQKINLSKNKWALRTGATSMLASSSIIADEYREFVERLEGTFQLDWQEKQPITNFANEKVKLSLNDTKQVDIAFPEDVWVEGKISNEGNLTTFTVAYVIRERDVKRLAVAEFAGSGKNLNLKLVDLAGKSDIVDTKFRVKYRVRADRFGNLPNSQKEYSGEIPPELVTREYNRFILALEQLPIPAEALRSGLTVDIEVIATRTLGKRSTKQTLNWQGPVRNS